MSVQNSPLSETTQHFSLEMIPETGYRMGAHEAIEFQPKFSDNTPDGFLDQDGRIPYKSVIGLVVGNEDNHTSMSIVMVPRETDNSYKDGTFVVDFRTTRGVEISRLTVGAIEDGIIGRSSRFMDGMPDAVANAHLLVRADETGKLRIRNLASSGETVLLRTTQEREEQPESRSPRRPKSPKEMAATRAIDPATGLTVNGPTVNAHNPKELLDPRTGETIGVIPTDGDEAQISIEAARKSALIRRRKKNRPQQRARQLPY